MITLIETPPFRLNLSPAEVEIHASLSNKIYQFTKEFFASLYSGFSNTLKQSWKQTKIQFFRDINPTLEIIEDLEDGNEESCLENLINKIIITLFVTFSFFFHVAKTVILFPLRVSFGICPNLYQSFRFWYECRNRGLECSEYQPWLEQRNWLEIIHTQIDKKLAFHHIVKAPIDLDSYNNFSENNVSINLIGELYSLFHFKERSTPLIPLRSPLESYFPLDDGDVPLSKESCEWRLENFCTNLIERRDFLRVPKDERRKKEFYDLVNNRIKGYLGDWIDRVNLFTKKHAHNLLWNNPPLLPKNKLEDDFKSKLRDFGSFFQEVADNLEDRSSNQEMASEFKALTLEIIGFLNNVMVISGHCAERYENLAITLSGRNFFELNLSVEERLFCFFAEKRREILIQLVNGWTQEEVWRRARMINQDDIASRLQFILGLFKNSSEFRRLLDYSTQEVTRIFTKTMRQLTIQDAKILLQEAQRIRNQQNAARRILPELTRNAFRCKTEEEFDKNKKDISRIFRQLVHSEVFSLIEPLHQKELMALVRRIRLNRNKVNILLTYPQFLCFAFHFEKKKSDLSTPLIPENTFLELRELVDSVEYMESTVEIPNFLKKFGPLLRILDSTKISCESASQILDKEGRLIINDPSRVFSEFFEMYNATFITKTFKELLQRNESWDFIFQQWCKKLGKQSTWKKKKYEKTFREIVAEIKQLNETGSATGQQYISFLEKVEELRDSEKIKSSGNNIIFITPSGKDETVDLVTENATKIIRYILMEEGSSITIYQRLRTLQTKFLQKELLGEIKQILQGNPISSAFRQKLQKFTRLQRIRNSFVARLLAPPSFEKLEEAEKSKCLMDLLKEHLESERCSEFLHALMPPKEMTKNLIQNIQMKLQTHQVVMDVEEFHSLTYPFEVEQKLKAFLHSHDKMLIADFFDKKGNLHKEFFPFKYPDHLLVCFLVDHKVLMPEALSSPLDNKAGL